MRYNYVVILAVALFCLENIPSAYAGSNLRGHLPTHESMKHDRYYNSSNRGNPIADFFFGFLLVFLSIPMLWYNERRQAINEYRFQHAEKACISINCLEYNPSTEGQLVHTNGQSSTRDLVVDAQFGLSETNTVKLKRSVEMYQWVRHETRNGDETRVEYRQQWSSEFEETGGGQYYNDRSKWVVQKQEFMNQNVQLGSYLLSQSLKEQLSNYQKVNLSMENATYAKQNFGMMHSNIFSSGEYIMFCQSPGGGTTLGDLRVSFSKVPCGNTTVVSQQQQNSFVKYEFQDKFTETLRSDDDIGGCCICCQCIRKLEHPIMEVDWVWPEIFDKSQAFKDQRQTQKCITLALRIGGYFVMGIGFCLIFSPISTIISWIPFLGHFLAGLTAFIFGLVSFTIAIPLTLFVITCAWLWYHPKVGAVLLLITLAIAGAIYYYIAHSEAHQKE